MAGFLFDNVVFGPIYSRRMGSSLGVNLLPLKHKYCTFDCIYCECGWTTDRVVPISEFPPLTLISSELEKKLQQLAALDQLPDSITFSGNGEPTLHPEFDKVVSETIRLRDLYSPGSLITVLSNGTTIHREEVFKALLKVDQNIQKLDAGTHASVLMVNQPAGAFDLPALVENLSRFRGKVIIQTLFLRGMFQGMVIDNTTPEEVGWWITHLTSIQPSSVMIYSLDRATPANGLEKISVHELDAIAEKVRLAGLITHVYA